MLGAVGFLKLLLIDLANELANFPYVDKQTGLIFDILLTFIASKGKSSTLKNT